MIVSEKMGVLPRIEERATGARSARLHNSVTVDDYPPPVVPATARPPAPRCSQ